MYPLGETYPTDPAVANAMTFWQGQLHGAALAINQAKKRGDVAAVQALIPKFQQAMAEYNKAGAQQLNLSAFEQFLLDTDRWVEAAAKGTVQTGKNLLQETRTTTYVLGGLAVLGLYFLSKSNGSKVF